MSLFVIFLASVNLCFREYRGFSLKGFCFVTTHKILFNLILLIAIFDIFRCPVWAGSKLPPNIPTDLFTPLFAMSRIAGWTAHVLEQYQNNRLIRPRARYVGQIDRTFRPIEQR